MVTTRPPKTIVKPTALGPVANTDTKLLIYGLFQKRPSFGTGRARVASRAHFAWFEAYRVRDDRHEVLKSLGAALSLASVSARRLAR